ncbi:MAG TPA: hypothetical protein VGN86_07085, partial [Pyrinomonadaceae bacterium]|nr:hypothetical protein [Pyrinomonadaceae bacterium]
ICKQKVCSVNWLVNEQPNQRCGLVAARQSAFPRIAGSFVKEEKHSAFGELFRVLGRNRMPPRERGFPQRVLV